jgi:hypothetical protein
VRSTTDICMLQIYCWATNTTQQRVIVVPGTASIILILYLYADCVYTVEAHTRSASADASVGIYKPQHATTAFSMHRTRVYIIWRPRSSPFISSTGNLCDAHEGPTHAHLTRPSHPCADKPFQSLTPSTIRTAAFSRITAYERTFFI